MRRAPATNWSSLLKTTGCSRPSASMLWAKLLTSPMSLRWCVPILISDILRVLFAMDFPLLSSNPLYEVERGLEEKERSLGYCRMYSSAVHVRSQWTED